MDSALIIVAVFIIVVCAILVLPLVHSTLFTTVGDTAENRLTPYETGYDLENCNDSRPQIYPYDNYMLGCLEGKLDRLIEIQQGGRKEKSELT